MEAGIRTTCSEPFDCEAGCSVFRPTVVKAIADNPDVGFVKEGLLVNGNILRLFPKLVDISVQKLIQQYFSF